jgi:hypothetical protein
MSGVMADMARLIVGWDTPSDSPISACLRLCPHVGQRGHYRFEKTEAWRPIRGSCPGLHGIDPDAEVDDFFAIEPSGMMHVMACSTD